MHDGLATSVANVLGTFAHTYEGPTSRVATVAYPNGQTSGYTYFGNTVDRRLQTIHHKYPNGTTLSKFDYTYDAVGNIVTWQQQGGTAALWSYGYDAADQLTSASSLVRCCLFAAYARGLGNNEAHALCYAGATAVTGVAFIPYDTLYRCYGRCKEEQQKNCTTC